MTSFLSQPPDTIEIRTFKFPKGELVPNNARYPAVLAKQALGGVHDENAVEALFKRNSWSGTWTWEVFDYHHFHPDAFEVLGVASGAAVLMLGGPQGETVEVGAGDVMILPPGFGHKQVAKHGNFRICGAYPPGQENYSIIRADKRSPESTLTEIMKVRPPESDPIWGQGGPLLAHLLGRA